MRSQAEEPGIDLPLPVDSGDASMYHVETSAPGPQGSLPFDDEFLRTAPSGDIFGLSQSAGMGWNPAQLRRPEFLILGTMGGIRAPDGTPIALGYHTGHWEIGLLMEAAAKQFAALGMVPFAGNVSDPCDGRSQGTTGMMDSLPYRNDAAIVLRRLTRSLPTCKGVMGVATCDKGLPAMMIALASAHDLPSVLVPGGVTLPPDGGRGRRQDSVRGRTLCARRDFAGRGGGTRLQKLRLAGRRLSVPGHGGDQPGRGGSAGVEPGPFGAGAVRPADLA